MNTVRAKEIGKRAAMTVKRLRRVFDQHLSIGEQCSECVSHFKSEGLGRTTVPCHFWRIDPREANRFSRVKNQRIAVNKFSGLTEPLFGLGNNLCRTEKGDTTAQPQWVVVVRKRCARQPRRRGT